MASWQSASLPRGMIAPLHRFPYWLQTSYKLARLVLACFALTLYVAVVSPIVQPKALGLVCTGTGSVKLVTIDGDEGQGAVHTLDCLLCLPVSLPALPVPHQLVLPVVFPDAQYPFASVHIAALLGAPLPARGPPLGPDLDLMHSQVVQVRLYSLPAKASIQLAG